MAEWEPSDKTAYSPLPTEEERPPRGAVAENGRRRADALKEILAWLGVVNLVALAVVGYVAIDGAGEAKTIAATIETKEDQQIDLVRRATWRICERTMRDRALAHALIGEASPTGAGDTRSENTKVRRLVEQQNPIVDCDPNLRGEPADPLPSAAQREFVRRWQRGELDPLPEVPGEPPGLRPTPPGKMRPH